VKKKWRRKKKVLKVTIPLLHKASMLACWVPPALYRARSPPKSLPASRFSTRNSLAGFTRKLTSVEMHAQLPIQKYQIARQRRKKILGKIK
jgi:hypothetical protein